MVNRSRRCLLQTIFVLLAMVSLNFALPVSKQKKDENITTSTPATPELETALEYERYLKEVVEALENDPEFRKKLDKAPEADIRSGKIAQELDYVSHHVRTKLDEIKRRELERLRHLANKAYELSNDIDREHLKVPQHIDHGNEHTFEIEDLRKLIIKTSNDLAEADRKRRAEFKEYEMQKEFERESVMKEMNEEQRNKYEAELKEKEEKHKQHDKLHHPGNKAQLEDVWENQDHMDKEDFEPHIDSNGYWDEAEVKALFVKELDKVYQSGLPEDDMRERAEEMERMREHYFQETDTNHDGLISMQEFVTQTQKEEFQKDPEWETVDQQPQYTHEEYLEFERHRQEELQRMIAQGLLPPHPNMPQGYYPSNGQPINPQQNNYQQQAGPQMHYQQAQQQHIQQQQQYHQQQQQYAQQQSQPIQLQPQQVYQNIPAAGHPVQLQPNQVYQHVNPQVQVQQQQPIQSSQQQQVPAPLQHQQLSQQPYQQAQQQQHVNNQSPPAVVNQQQPIQQQQEQQQAPPQLQEAQQQAINPQLQQRQQQASAPAKL